MKWLIAGVLVLSVELAGVASPQVSMPCGPGVIIRAEGSIIIDAYTIYPTPAAQPMPPGAPQSSNTFKFETKEGPIGITLGKSLSGETPICIETAAGSRCVALKLVRAVR